MISAPRGIIRLAALRLLSQSSLSGIELQEQIERSSPSRWRPGPGSIYFVLKELREGDLIVELPHRGGTTRRYVISSKGRNELSRLSKDVKTKIRRQLELLSFYCSLAGDSEIEERLKSLAREIYSL
jgi:DNA-binding PadR family transcriptional regulator